MEAHGGDEVSVSCRDECRMSTNMGGTGMCHSRDHREMGCVSQRAFKILWGSEEMDSGVSGLMVVAAEGGERGLTVVDSGEGIGLAVLEEGRGRPVISANSDGLGFHELR